MKICGIYKIVNKTNGKYYVGSSNDITGNFGRWYEHKWELKRKSHHNDYLQRSWDKYGENEFDWIVIETVPENQLLIIEQRYLDVAKTEQDRCYNLTFDATAPTRSMNEESKKRMIEKLKRHFSIPSNNPMYGKHHTKKSRLKMALSRIGKAPSNKGVPMSDVQKKELSRKAKERLKNPKQNPSYDHTKHYFVNEKTQDTFNGTMYDFRMNLGLDRSKVSSLVNGHLRHYKGWKIK